MNVIEVPIQRSKPMQFLRHQKRHVKRITSFFFCLALLAIILLPSHARALQVTNTNATATITSLSFNFLSFNDPTQAFLSAQSGVQVGLNGVQGDPGSDFTINGLWTPPTAWSDSLSSMGSTTSGSASTFSGILSVASSTMAISLLAPGNAGVGVGVPNNSQATLYSAGLFATANAHLIVTAGYSLSASVSSTIDVPGAFANAGASAGLFLYGYDTFGPLNDPLLVSGFSFDQLAASIIGSGGQSFSTSGTLTLEYDLLANNFYDFEASVVTTGDANAPVPEPATILLIGSGLAGLGAYRKSKKKA
jgi:hypothetical protein